jgi:hypothetical protein
MAEVTLGDALKLAKEAEIKASELNSLLLQVSTITYTKDETPEKPETTVEEIDQQVMFQYKKARYLRQLVAQTNIETLNDFTMKNTIVTQAEAILLLSQLLKQKRIWNQLANNRPKTRLGNRYETIEYQEITYNLDNAKKDLSNIEHDIRTLRTCIDRVNINTILEIPDEYAEF